MIAGFEDVSDGFGAADLSPDGGEGVGEIVPFIGAIENFPITKLAAAAQTERTGGDTAEREGDHGELASGEGAGVARGGESRRSGGLVGRRFDDSGDGCGAEKCSTGRVH